MVTVLRVGWVLTRRTVREVFDDRVLGLAAEAAFWALLSLPPLALVVLGSLGYVGEALGPQAVARLHTTVVDVASGVLTPETVDEVFLYILAFAILLGAELNAEIDEMWPADSTAEGRERSRARARERQANRRRRPS